jgi:hypothetical protein
MEQRLLTLGNQLPQGINHTRFCAASPTVPALAEAALGSLAATLDRVADIGDVLIGRVPEMGAAKLQAETKKRAREDSEAESHSDRLWTRLSAQWDALADYRDSTVNAWGRKMQVWDGTVPSLAVCAPCSITWVCVLVLCIHR